jgi:glucose-6-phosphate 1-dehydrogenase
MTAPRSDALVIFGATGDLAHKQIFPALQALVRRGHLDMPVIGVAIDEEDVAHLRARAKDSLEQHGGLDPAAFAKLSALLRYVHGDYRDAATFGRLRRALGDAHRPLHYLAIPPSMFATVADGLAKSRCAEGARVVVEKPFGRNLTSAMELNRTLRAHFDEQAIFRIDHYLGKEPVQNLLYFRCANPMVEAGWNREHVESVQITMAEKFGVAGRGKLYEETGAIRDVVQNHMLQLVACVAMEASLGHDHEVQRDARSKLLESVRTLVPSDVVRGQYRGYRQEPAVAADSKMETFAAVRFHIDSDRWRDVPFYARVGKSLPVTATEVRVRFKPAPGPGVDEPGFPSSNYYRFQVSPEVVIGLGVGVKKPGVSMVGEGIELVAHHQPPDEMAPYERLLGDAANGDPTLFAREDSVEASWRIVDPILQNQTPLYEYEPGTWGPSEAGPIMTSPGGWHDPGADHSADVRASEARQGVRPGATG